MAEAQPTAADLEDPKNKVWDSFFWFFASKSLGFGVWGLGFRVQGFV